MLTGRGKRRTVARAVLAIEAWTGSIHFWERAVRIRSLVLAIASMAGFVAGAAGASAAELVVISTTAAKEALIEIVPMFERASGQRVNITYGGGLALARKISEGLAGDLFIGPEEFTDPLLKEGKLVAGTRVAFALSGTGVAVKAGAPKPDIGTPEAFKNALLAAKSISFSTGASGIQFQKILERLSVASPVLLKRVDPMPGELVGAVVARGGAELGVQQISELLPVQGIDIVGPLPDELQTWNRYGATVMPGSTQRNAAQAFEQFLRSDAAALVLKRKGLVPVQN